MLIAVDAAEHLLAYVREQNVLVPECHSQSHRVHFQISCRELIKQPAHVVHLSHLRLGGPVADQLRRKGFPFVLAFN